MLSVPPVLVVIGEIPVAEGCPRQGAEYVVIVLDTEVAAAPLEEEGPNRTIGAKMFLLHRKLERVYVL
jgi:hypothetical protein